MEVDDDKEFNIADYIEYTPHPDQLNELENGTNSVDNAHLKLNDNSSVPVDNESLAADTAHNYSVSHDKILERIREFQSSCNESELKTKTDMFVCGLCLDLFATPNLLRQHFIKAHDYVSAESDPEEEADTSQNVSGIDDRTTIKVAINASVDLPLNSKQSDEKDDKESEWQKPISLKALKKILNRLLTIKCSFSGCSYYFASDERRQMHEKCHTSMDPEQVRQFKCLKCSNESKIWRDCSSHMWKEHKIDIDLLNCPFCSFKAVFSVKIYRHLQSHSQMKGFQCSSCPTSFEQFNQLRQHVATAHIDKNGPSRWYSKKTCDICSNVFATSKTLSKHIKAVHNRIKPFICNVCNYKSARKSTWEIHMRQHTGEKPMTCKVCSFCTADPSVLRKHEMRHNDKTKYQCIECEYTSIQSINFKNHMKRHHPEYYQKLLCDQCSFVSVNLDALRKHLQDHKLGLIRNEDSNDERATSTLVDTQRNSHNGSIEISSDSFLPVESIDSLANDAALDTGGVTIPALPAQHSDEAQFPSFEN